MFLRPNADDVDGGWLDQAGGTSLFAAIDEASVDDADYIQSPANPAAAMCRVALANPGAGTKAGPFIIRPRYYNFGCTLQIRLVQGASTEIAAWTETAEGWNTTSYTLTAPQFAAITDFDDLFIEFTADVAGVDPTLVLDLDFTLSDRLLDSRITFTRSTTATYYDSDGVLRLSRNNEALQSEDLTTTWAVGDLAIAADQIVAPNGTTTADRLTDNASNGYHQLYQAVPVPDIGPATVSFYAKAGTGRYLGITLAGSNTLDGASATIDLVAGTVTRSAALAAGTLHSATIEALADGWHRITLASSTTVSNTHRYVIFSGATVASPTVDSLGRQVYVGTGLTWFVWGVQLEQGNAPAGVYARTTTIAAAAPRFDHDPVTLEPRGLLMGAQCTNLALNSDNFSSWTVERGTIAADNAAGPAGAASADKYTEDSASGEHRIYQLLSGTSAVTSGYSIYAKAGTRSWLALRNASAGFVANFNLSTGSVGTSANCVASMQDVGSGWWRCLAIGTTLVTNDYFIINMGDADTGVTNSYPYAGNGSGHIWLWGAQAEVGAFATSYIPTTAAAVTRAADVAIMTGSNFSSWYNQPEGTILLEAIFGPQADSTDRHYLNLNNNTESERHILQGVVNTLTVAGAMVTASSLEAYAGVGSYTATQLNKFAYAYKLNDFGACLNGGTVGTDTSCVMPTPNRAGIGRGPSGIETPKEWWLSRFAFYNVRKSNAELQALTAL